MPSPEFKYVEGLGWLWKWHIDICWRRIRHSEAWTRADVGAWFSYGDILKPQESPDAR